MFQVRFGTLSSPHESGEESRGEEAEVAYLLLVRRLGHLGIENLEPPAQIPDPRVGPEAVPGIEGKEGAAVGFQDGPSLRCSPPHAPGEGGVAGPCGPEALPVIHGQEVVGPKPGKLGTRSMGRMQGRGGAVGRGCRGGRRPGMAPLQKAKVLPRHGGGLGRNEKLLGISAGKGQRTPQGPAATARALRLDHGGGGQEEEEGEGQDRKGETGGSAGGSGLRGEGTGNDTPCRGPGPSKASPKDRAGALFSLLPSPHLQGHRDVRFLLRSLSGPKVQMLTIDIHAHIGSFAGYDLSEATLLSEVAAQGVDLALVSNIDGAAVPGKTRDLPEEVANAATVRFVRSYPDRFRGLLWGRPDRGDATALEPFTLLRIPESPARPAHPSPPGAGGARWTSRLFVGLKLHPEMNRVPADDPALDPYLALADRHRLPVVVHCDGSVEEASAPRFLALGRRHPRVPIVLYHTGFGGPHEPAMEVVEEALADGSADLWLETSQLPPAVALEAVERVGAERVLFGTDATFFGAGHYARYGPLLEALESGLPEEAVARILHGNALDLFRLRPESP